ncbi:hypothetical protein DFH06DRAFT_1395324 [Mycena polygramma]|nr:hypothetical protein DFH06DRAFT_1395324 [Mycena polygramma]
MSNNQHLHGPARSIVQSGSTSHTWAAGGRHRRGFHRLSFNGPSTSAPDALLAPFYNPEPWPQKEDARDFWHGERLLCVPLVSPVPANISIPFRPLCGPGKVGVALTELALSRGFRHPRDHLWRMPPGVAVGQLILTWPTYPNTRVSVPLNLKDVSGEYLFRGAFAKQIAAIFKAFIEARCFLGNMAANMWPRPTGSLDGPWGPVRSSTSS